MGEVVLGLSPLKVGLLQGSLGKAEELKYPSSSDTHLRVILRTEAHLWSVKEWKTKLSKTNLNGITLPINIFPGNSEYPWNVTKSYNFHTIFNKSTDLYPLYLWGQLFYTRTPTKVIYKGQKQNDQVLTMAEQCVNKKEWRLSGKHRNRRVWQLMCPVQGEGTNCQGLLCGLLPTELPLPVPSSSPSTVTGGQPVTSMRWWATWGAVAFSPLYSQCGVHSEHLIHVHWVYWSTGALYSEWGCCTGLAMALRKQPSALPDSVITKVPSNCWFYFQVLHSWHGNSLDKWCECSGLEILVHALASYENDRVHWIGPSSWKPAELSSRSYAGLTAPR